MALLCQFRHSVAQFVGIVFLRLFGPLASLAQNPSPKSIFGIEPGADYMLLLNALRAASTDGLPRVGQVSPDPFSEKE